MKWTPEGRLLMNLGTGAPAGDNNAKYAFNRPATLNFLTNGDFLSPMATETRAWFTTAKMANTWASGVRKVPGTANYSGARCCH
jgi:hypothetical protein